MFFVNHEYFRQDLTLVVEFSPQVRVKAITQRIRVCIFGGVPVRYVREMFR